MCKNGFWEGFLRGPVQHTIPDMETAMQSIRKFLQLDIDSIVCYHGGLKQGGITEDLKKVIG